MSVSDGEESLSEKDHPDTVVLELTCPICLHLYSEPVSLPCGHIYCCGCLQTMGEGLDQHSCPECHAGYEGTKSFKMHSTVETSKDTTGTANDTTPQTNTSDTATVEWTQENSAESNCMAGSSERPCLDEGRTRSKPKVETDDAKFRLASQVTELTLRLEMAEGVLKKEQQWELEVAAANTHLREKTAELLGQMQALSQSYSTKMMQMIEEELGPGEAGICGRVCRASELTKQLRQAVLRAESLLTEEDAAAFSDDLQTLQPNIEALLVTPIGEEEAQRIESKLNPARTCSKLEEMNAELRERLGEIQRSLRNRLNPSEVTFDPDTAHPNLVLSEDLKTVTFSSAKQPYPSSPQRFTSFFQVLSSQSFSEGEHSWEVELEGAPWIIGVCYSRHVPRSGLPSALESSRSSWCLMWFNNLLTAFEQGHDVPLKRTTLSRRLEIKLSFKTHRLSFYNISPISGNTHVYTFKANLTEPVRLAYRMMSGQPKARVTIYS